MLRLLAPAACARSSGMHAAVTRALSTAPPASSPCLLLILFHRPQTRATPTSPACSASAGAGAGPWCPRTRSALPPPPPPASRSSAPLHALHAPTQAPSPSPVLSPPSSVQPAGRLRRGLRWQVQRARVPSHAVVAGPRGLAGRRGRGRGRGRGRRWWAPPPADCFSRLAFWPGSCGCLARAACVCPRAVCRADADALSSTLHPSLPSQAGSEGESEWEAEDEWGVFSVSASEGEEEGEEEAEAEPEEARRARVAAAEAQRAKRFKVGCETRCLRRPDMLASCWLISYTLHTPS